MKKVIILGKAGSGKSFLERGLEKKGLKRCIKWTDRPLRSNERQDIDYHFIDSFDNITPTFDDIFIIKQSFKIKDNKDNPIIWSYAISLNNFIDSDVAILTPHEYEFMKYHGNTGDTIFFNRINTFVIYLDIDETTRRERLKKRYDIDDIDRRISADDNDFKRLDDVDLIICDNNFSIDDIYSKIR